MAGALIHLGIVARLEHTPVREDQPNRAGGRGGVEAEHDHREASDAEAPRTSEADAPRTSGSRSHTSMRLLSPPRWVRVTSTRASRSSTLVCSGHSTNAI